MHLVWYFKLDSLLCCTHPYRRINQHHTRYDFSTVNLEVIVALRSKLQPSHKDGLLEWRGMRLWYVLREG